VSALEHVPQDLAPLAAAIAQAIAQALRTPVSRPDRGRPKVEVATTLLDSTQTNAYLNLSANLRDAIPDFPAPIRLGKNRNVLRWAVADLDRWRDAQPRQ
jgi:predicted DNA-binding transcriptional regulator AlpA